MQAISTDQQSYVSQSEKVKERFVYVCQLHDGRIVVGTATNPCKRMVALNSGVNPAVPKPLQINRVIGVKPVDETRNAITVFKKFEEAYGEGNVIAV